MNSKFLIPILILSYFLCSCQGQPASVETDDLTKKRELVNKGLAELSSWEHMIYSNDEAIDSYRQKDYMIAVSNLNRLLNNPDITKNTLQAACDEVQMLASDLLEDHAKESIIVAQLIAKYRLRLDWPSTPQEDETHITYLAEQNYRDLSLLWDAYKGLAKQKQMQSPKNLFSGYLSAAKSADPKLFQKMKPHHKAACEKALQEIEAYK